jgi:hypothetical protein
VLCVCVSVGQLNVDFVCFLLACFVYYNRFFSFRFFVSFSELIFCIFLGGGEFLSELILQTSLWFLHFIRKMSPIVF